MISSVETTNQLRLNLLTQESQEIRKHLTKKVPNLLQTVDGVAVKDTTAKYALLKMLPVTNARKGDMFVAALHRQLRKYVNWRKMKSRKRGVRFYFLRKFKPKGVVGLPNSELMAEIFALSWIRVLQSQSLVRIPRG